MEEAWRSMALLFIADDTDLLFPSVPLPTVYGEGLELAENHIKGTKRSKAQRRWWVRPWIKRRGEHNDCTMFSLPKELIELDDTSEFRALLRMDAKRYTMLLEKVRPFITFKDTKMRRAISAEERLIITLKYMATGESGVSLSQQFRVGRSTICRILKHTATAIYEALKDDYLTTPNTLEAWQVIANLFWEKWNFPHCLGALDGKHVYITPPPNSGSTFYNYKGRFSIIMLALVDANYEFIFLDVGAEGRAGDAGVWNRSSFKSAINDGELPLPGTTPLPGTNTMVPHVIVADDAFRLTSHIMKPYSRRNLSLRECVFNYRLSRARRVSENAFGILANRFRAFLKPLNQTAEGASDTVLACCALHNFLRREIGEGYLALTQEEHEEVLGAELGSGPLISLEETPHARNSSRVAKNIREELANFFMSEDGSLHWQIASVTV